MSVSMFCVMAATTLLARVQAHPFVRNADLPAAITGLAVALVLTITYGLVTRAPSARIVTMTVLAVAVVSLLAGVCVVWASATFDPGRDRNLLFLPAAAGVLLAALQNVVLASGVSILYLVTSRASRYRVLVPMLMWIPGAAIGLSDLVSRSELPVPVQYVPLLGGVAWLVVTVLVGRRFTEAAK